MTDIDLDDAPVEAIILAKLSHNHQQIFVYLLVLG